MSIRKLTNPKPESRKQKSNIINFNDYTLDMESRSLKSNAGIEIHLTPTELNILAAFSGRPNTAFSRNEVLDVITTDSDAPSDRAVDVYVARLRQKIEKDPKQPTIIKSDRGVGYKLVP